MAVVIKDPKDAIKVLNKAAYELVGGIVRGLFTLKDEQEKPFFTVNFEPINMDEVWEEFYGSHTLKKLNHDIDNLEDSALSKEGLTGLQLQLKLEMVNASWNEMFGQDIDFETFDIHTTILPETWRGKLWGRFGKKRVKKVLDFLGIPIGSILSALNLDTAFMEILDLIKATMENEEEDGGVGGAQATGDEPVEKGKGSRRLVPGKVDF